MSASLNVNSAEEEMRYYVCQYICDNYDAVYQTCHKTSQINSDSKEILRAPCCNKQFHEKCLIACKVHQVKSCPNGSCQIAENGAHSSRKWDNAFYDTLLSSRPLSRRDIANETCLLCADNLKETLNSGALKVKRKRKFNGV